MSREQGITTSGSEAQKGAPSADKAALLHSVPARNTPRNANYRELFQRVQRRNGEIVDFDRSRIVEAIWKAARSVGGTDYRTADLLADKVILYLSRTYEDHLLNIEEIQDAVEKVLIENGHAKTAKAYILYRQERARVRRFRGEQPLPKSASTPAPQTAADIEVLTSGQQLVRWNRDMITQALVRETGLAAALADRISREVERQIIYSKTSRLTASLVRELVNVNLLEYGFLTERQLHSRLGVPLYDVKQMIEGRLPGEPGSCPTPGTLQSALAGSILTQYSLSRVFSSEVTDAHLRGDIVLNGLSDPWRVEESIQSLEYLKKTGLCAPDFAVRRAPAGNAEELIAQWGKVRGSVGRLGPLALLWDGVNLFLAPLLEGAEDEELERIARLVLLEIAARPSIQVAQGPVRSLGFYFQVPKSLWNTAALGPAGRPSGKTYAFYQETARRLLRAFLELLSKDSQQGNSFPGLEFCFHLDPAFAGSPQATQDLEWLEKHLPRLGQWCAWFHGSPSANAFGPDHFCAEGSSECPAVEYKYPWKLRTAVGPVITLNLLALATGLKAIRNDFTNSWNTRFISFSLLSGNTSSFWNSCPPRDCGGLLPG